MENKTDPRTNSNFSYLVILFVGILAVSTASIFIRFAQSEVPSLVIAAGRLTIAALVILPLALRSWKNHKPRIPGKTWLLMVLAGFFLGFHFVTWITSLEYTSIASSVVLVTTAPLWVALLSPLFLKEKLTRWVLIGLVVSLSGSIIVSFSSNCTIFVSDLSCLGLGDLWSSRHFLGNLLALAGAFLSAGYIMVGRKVRNTVGLTEYTGIVYGVASIVLVCLVLLTRSRVTGYSETSYMWIVALAIIPQVIGHTAFNWALKYLSAAFVAIALLGEPVGTIILAAFLLSENPTTLEIIGGVLILTGITIATRQRGPFARKDLQDHPGNRSP